VEGSPNPNANPHLVNTFNHPNYLTIITLLHSLPSYFSSLPIFTTTTTVVYLHTKYTGFCFRHIVCVCVCVYTEKTDCCCIVYYAVNTERLRSGERVSSLTVRGHSSVTQSPLVTERAATASCYCGHTTHNVAQHAVLQRCSRKHSTYQRISPHGQG